MQIPPLSNPLSSYAYAQDNYENYEKYPSQRFICDGNKNILTIPSDKKYLVNYDVLNNIQEQSEENIQNEDNKKEKLDQRNQSFSKDYGGQCDSFFSPMPHLIVTSNKMNYKRYRLATYT